MMQAGGKWKKLTHEVGETWRDRREGCGLENGRIRFCTYDTGNTTVAEGKDQHTKIFQRNNLIPTVH